MIDQFNGGPTPLNEWTTPMCISCSHRVALIDIDFELKFYLVILTVDFTLIGLKVGVCIDAFGRIGLMVWIYILWSPI